jgi:hypothetical protein
VIALFFMRERDRYGFDKKRAGTHYAELVFFQPVDLQITSCIPVSRARNVIALFFMLRSDWYGFDKKRSGTPYAELVFWHQLGCAGIIVYSGASGAQNLNALIFMLEWAWEGFH